MKFVIILPLFLALNSHASEIDFSGKRIGLLYVSEKECGELGLKYETKMRMNQEPYLANPNRFKEGGSYSVAALNEKGDKIFSKENVGFLENEINSGSCDAIYFNDKLAREFCSGAEKAFYFRLENYQDVRKIQLFKDSILLKDLNVDYQDSSGVSWNWKFSCFIDQVRSFFK